MPTKTQQSVKYSCNRNCTVNFSTAVTKILLLLNKAQLSQKNSCQLRYTCQHALRHTRAGTHARTHARTTPPLTVQTGPDAYMVTMNCGHKQAEKHAMKTGSQYRNSKTIESCSLWRRSFPFRSDVE